MHEKEGGGGELEKKDGNTRSFVKRKAPEDSPRKKTSGRGGVPAGDTVAPKGYSPLQTCGWTTSEKKNKTERKERSAGERDGRLCRGSIRPERNTEACWGASIVDRNGGGKRYEKR